MASEGTHEPYDKLGAATLERHRAIVSIMEELEAVDWYDQRVDVSADPELAGVLAHNRDEEKEHASMTLEWLRRHGRPPASDSLYTERGGKVSATLNILSVDKQTNTLVITRNNPVPAVLARHDQIQLLNDESIPVGSYRDTRPVICEVGLEAGLLPSLLRMA